MEDWIRKACERAEIKDDGKTLRRGTRGLRDCASLGLDLLLMFRCGLGDGISAACSSLTTKPTKRCRHHSLPPALNTTELSRVVRLLLPAPYPRPWVGKAPRGHFRDECRPSRLLRSRDSTLHLQPGEAGIAPDETSLARIRAVVGSRSDTVLSLGRWDEGRANCWAVPRVR